jgi:glycerophosphoryl diester phosphodiesterase
MAREFDDRPSWRTRGAIRPLVLGHRGASGIATENTLAAFQRAVADGADGVELDVQRCRTGEIVVFHDDDLRRLAGRPERIIDLSMAELREIRLHGGGEIPTLAETFEACGASALVNVEIKYEGFLPGGCSALVAGTADVIARAGAGPRVLVSSFSPAAVWLWQRRHPSVPCGLLFEPVRRFHKPWPLRTDWLLPALSTVAVHPDHRMCRPDTVERWHRRGYGVNVWTVDDRDRIRALAAMGVDGIITNDPASALAALSLTV